MRRLAATLLVALAVAGCGGEAGDLMAIEIAKGPARGRELDIVIKGDGRGTCNGGDEKAIPSGLVIDARELERDLSDLAEQSAFFEPTGAGRREYVVRIKAGTVRWSEGDRGLPRELPRTQLLALKLDRLLCR